MEIMESRLITEAKRDGVDRFVVGAIVLKSLDDNRFALLTLERQANDFMGGIDELPSGKVENGEQLREALYREVQEETGLAITDILGFLWHFDYRSGSGRQTRQFNFLVAVHSVESIAVSPEEHCGYRWLALENLQDSKLTPNIVEALSQHQEQIVALYKDQNSNGA